MKKVIKQIIKCLKLGNNEATYLKLGNAGDLLQQAQSCPFNPEQALGLCPLEGLLHGISMQLQVTCLGDLLSSLSMHRISPLNSSSLVSTVLDWLFDWDFASVS